MKDAVIEVSSEMFAWVVTSGHSQSNGMIFGLYQQPKGALKAGKKQKS